MRFLTIGTRGSSLAMCQAQIVQTKLEELFPQCPVHLEIIKARADLNPQLPLSAMSTEGIFVKELEAALLEGRIDLAVHSLKDLPLDQPAGLTLAAVLEREESRDAWVSREGLGFEEQSPGSRVGTSSLRRKSQILKRRHDLELVEIRGNVDTRLRKLQEGQYDVVVVAACGLIRLGLEDRISEYLDFDLMLPEPGQGALAIETRLQDSDVIEMIGRLDEPSSRASVEAERAFLRALGGGCRVPIAAYAFCNKDGQLTLEGTVVAQDGSRQIRGCLIGEPTNPQALGENLAQQLIAQGAQELLS